MGVVRDMMKPFELFQPTELDGALDLLSRHGSDAWILSGGMDTFDWLKDRAKQPSVVVDLGGVSELKGIEGTEDGIRIGAMASLTEVATHPEITSRYPLLAESAEKVATPQIRQQGTLGGNLCQDTRCWYYRSGWPCYRAGGNICYANTPTALNREHCVFEANRCVAVSPSDTAPALIALDARMTIRSRRSERTVEAEDFFLGPATDITRMTVLRPGELLTEIHVPQRWAGQSYYFEKVADRKAWDFALANVAATFQRQNGRIQDARICVGAVAAKPLRLRNVEAALRGQSVDNSLLEQVGELAVRNARPLRQNEYKVSLTRNLVKRAIRDART